MVLSYWVGYRGGGVLVMQMQFRSNAELYDFARNYLVAGVSGSGRVNTSLGYPVYFARGDGARIYGIDGKEYIDFNMSHGATFLGHNHPAIRKAIEQALDMGIICSCETEFHAQLAKMITEMVPCAELVRFVPSGTEATMAAIRLARGFTGRDKIIKFEGHFHGLHDYVMYGSMPPAAETDSRPYLKPFVQSAGIPQALSQLVMVLPWNDVAAIEQSLAEHGNEPAAVIMEPISYNSGCIAADREYLQVVRELTREKEILLIFDEVLSAFRTGPDCAQGYYGVIPDLCTVGKAIANGVPLAVIAGKQEVMNALSPVGKVVQSGTYSGHLFGILAGIACLQEITKEGFYDHIYALADRLYSGLNRLFAMYHIPGHVQGLGARFGIYFGIEQEVRNYQEAARCDKELMARFVRGCFEQGVYFASIGHAIGHHGFSAAHTLEDIDQALNRMEVVFKHLK